MSQYSRRNVLCSGASIALLAGCSSTATLGISGTRSQQTAAEPITPKFTDGVSLAQKISTGETTAAAELEATIARTEALNPKINALVAKHYDLAWEQLSDLPDGPFKGVPTFIKDHMQWKGSPLRMGSGIFPDTPSDTDAPFSADWRAAGMVSVGKSTMPEAGLISTTEPQITGPTRNPWDLNRMTGGSSGGAAALVAARIVPFAHASDGGGSIRIPASTCGLFGMKTSAGRLSSHTDEPTPPVDMGISHALTLTVRDSIELFRVTERNDGRYPALGKIEALNRPLRIAFAPNSPGAYPVSAEVIESLEQTASLCESLGHQVIEYNLPFDGDAFTSKAHVYWSSFAAYFAGMIETISEKPVSESQIEPFTLGFYNMFIERQSELPDVIQYLQGFKNEYHSWFEDFDVLLTPVVARKPDPIGYQDAMGDFDEILERVRSYAQWTGIMNVAGAASMSVPLGMSPDNLPIGSMFSGKEGDDDLLFSLALQLEAAAPWIDRIPPVVAA